MLPPPTSHSYGSPAPTFCCRYLLEMPADACRTEALGLAFAADHPNLARFHHHSCRPTPFPRAWRRLLEPEVARPQPPPLVPIPTELSQKRVRPTLLRGHLAASLVAPSSTTSAPAIPFPHESPKLIRRKPAPLPYLDSPPPVYLPQEEWAPSSSKRLASSPLAREDVFRGADSREGHRYYGSENSNTGSASLEKWLDDVLWKSRSRRPRDVRDAEDLFEGFSWSRYAQKSDLKYSPKPNLLRNLHQKDSAGCVCEPALIEFDVGCRLNSRKQAQL